MERPASQNEREGVFWMAFRSRKVFGTFEKRTSDHQLDLFQVATGSISRLCFCIANWSASYQLGFLTCWVYFNGLFHWPWKAQMGRDQLSIHTGNREFKKRRRKRQRHKSMIWFAEWGKTIVLHVLHAFWWNFFHIVFKMTTWNFLYLKIWRQRELAAVNISISAFTWKPFVKRKRKCTSPNLLNVINLE